MPVTPPPDKSDQIAPLPPVNDGLKRPNITHMEPPVPADQPESKDPRHGDRKNHSD